MLYITTLTHSSDVFHSYSFFLFYFPVLGYISSFPTLSTTATCKLKHVQNVSSCLRVIYFLLCLFLLVVTSPSFYILPFIVFHSWQGRIYDFEKGGQYSMYKLQLLQLYQLTYMY